MGKKPKEKSDGEIIDAFLRRSEEAVAMVSEKYDRYLHRIAYNILGSDADCEECKNDTYLKLWNRIPPDRPTNFKAYIAQIIRNKALDRHRERSRGKRVPSEYTAGLAELEECIPDSFTVEKEVDDLALRKTVDEFIEGLTKRERYIFICRYCCGDAVEAIARSLEVSVSTVSHELMAIRKKLKEKIEKEGS